MSAEIDSLTIKDFEARYDIARSNVNNRIAGLKQKGYDMEPEKRDGMNVYNAEQIDLMDRLHAHIKAKKGNSIANFPADDEEVEVSRVSQDKPNSSYRTQDTLARVAQPSALQSLEQITALVKVITEQVTPPPAPISPVENLRDIQEACDRGWYLSSSQLAPLLGLKTLHGQEIKRHGFTFTRVGRDGRSSSWKVSKD